MPRSAIDMRAPFFRSAAQAALLHRLVLRIDEWVTLDELVSVRGSQMTTRRELLRLVDAGIVERRTAERPNRYRLPADGALTEHLVGLLDRTLGVESLLREQLAKLSGVTASIHGSWASGTATPRSDVDVLVLVDDDADDFDIAAVRDIEDSVGDLVGRRIDTMVYRHSEAKRKLELGSGFLRAVLDAPRIALVGDVEDALGIERAS